MRLNYVTVAWSGERKGYSGGPILSRDLRRAWLADKTLYLKLHVKALEHYMPEGLERRTITVPHNPDEPGYFRDYLDELAERGYHIFRTKNEGLSLGAFSRTVEADMDFDAWILAEDDYVYTIPDFPWLVRRLLNQNPHVDFLASWSRGRQKRDMRVWEMGVYRKSCIDRMWPRYGSIPGPYACRRKGTVGLDMKMRRLKVHMASLARAYVVIRWLHGRPRRTPRKLWNKPVGMISLELVELGRQNEVVRKVLERLGAPWIW